MSIRSSSPSLGIISELPSGDVNSTLADGISQRDIARGPFSAQKNARYLGEPSGLPDAPPLPPVGTAIDDGVTNARRAPALYIPQGGMSPIDVFTRLSIMTADSANESAEAVKANVMVTKEKVDRNTATQLAKLQEAQAKAADEEKSKRTGKIFGWIGKIAAFIGAAVAVVVTAAATVATGGTALPFLLLSVASLGAATLSLANQVSQEFGGPEISLSNGLSKMTIGLLEAFGVSSETAQKISDTVVGIAGPVLMFFEPDQAGAMASRFCEVLGVSPEVTKWVVAIADVVASVAVLALSVAAAFASGGTSLMGSISKTISTLARVLGGTAEIAQGGTSIHTAILRRDGDFIRAAVAELKAENLTSQRQMKNDQEMLQFLMQSVQDGMQSASDVLRNVFDNLSQISNNIGRRETA